MQPYHAEAERVALSEAEKEIMFIFQYSIIEKHDNSRWDVTDSISGWCWAIFVKQYGILIHTCLLTSGTNNHEYIKSGVLKINESGILKK